MRLTGRCTEDTRLLLKSLVRSQAKATGYDEDDAPMQSDNINTAGTRMLAPSANFALLQVVNRSTAACVSRGQVRSVCP